MATTKSTTPLSRTAKPRATRAKADPSLVARTGRTIKERPYTSAAIATGAVTAVAAAAAGAFFFSRRDKSLRETGDALATWAKDGLTEASEKIRGWVGSDEGKSQKEIAEEALTIKEIGKPDSSPVDDLTGERIKAGSVAH